MDKHKLAIIDARCSPIITQNLRRYAETIFLLKTTGITYESISCHPDIFLYQDEQHLVVAPNAPQELFNLLNCNNISYKIGHSVIGALLTDTCFYNCVSTADAFFHKEGFTDPMIQRLNQEKRFIALPQSYTRCSMLPLSDHAIITSDAGIHKVLQREQFASFLFTPDEIRIAVHRNGFLGGTCGISDGKIFFLGNPLRHKDGRGLCQFIESVGLEVIALSDEPLYDGGGIFFLRS
ncbi:MAG: hypothetical protein VZQ98_14515 [Bacteroidales bacterium]|nr:hypothetical protein [Bacteroidales bacterium]